MTKMLLARCALNQTALEGCEVAVLPFDGYSAALDTILSFVLSNDASRQKKTGYKWEWHEHPPFERLNDVLVGSAPSLIHGFNTHGENQKWSKSGLSTKRRFAMALSMVNKSPIWMPSVDQMNDLVYTWAEQWIRETFDVARYRGGSAALEAMRKAIYAVQTPWQPTNAAQLWNQYLDEEDTLVWSALSSVLASLFVHRMSGKVFPMSDGEKTEHITWQLTQEGNGQLAVVSKPFHHGKLSDLEGQGLVAYKVEFVLQTIAGSSEPWIAVFVSRRRFADRRVTAKNYHRDVTVLVNSMTVRKEGWTITPTWVRFQVKGWLKKGSKVPNEAANDEDKLRGIYWRNDTSGLWESWKARPLIEPGELFRTGGQLNFEQHQDLYLILHSEGMEYSPGTKHGAESGTSLLERKLIVGHVQEIMTDILVPDTSIDVDEISTLLVEDIFEKQLRALYTVEDIKHSTHALPIERGTGISADIQRHFAQRTLTDAAISIALGSKPLNLIIATEEIPARQVLEDYVRDTLFLEENEPLPSCICITPLQIPHHLNILPGANIPEQKTKADRLQAKASFPAEWADKSRDWKEHFQVAIMPGAHNIALVELNGRTNAITDKYTWRKTAARRGIYEAGASSQFVLTIPPKMAGDPSYFATQARSRVINAVRDALVRQTGLLYGSLPELYQYAGLAQEKAKELVVIALYRFRQNVSQKVDYPYAVELYGDGRIMVVIPDENGKPQSPISYIEAAIKIGQLFSRPMKQHWRTVNYQADQNDTRLGDFAHAVIGSRRSQPTLFLLEAASWRQRTLKITANPSLSKDIVNLSNKRYTPNDLPNIALLRIRDAGTLNETPQFIAGEEPSWTGNELPMDSDGMLGAVDSRQELIHFYSVARQSATINSNQDNEDFVFSDGGDTAFKHQKIVEMLPWFAQNDSERIVYCRIAHLLRFTPNWSHGNTVLPFPLHLAEALAKNVSEVFTPNIK